MNPWKPILAALVIFAAGVVTGGLTVKLRQPRAPHPGNQQIRNRTTLPRDSQLRELSRKMQTELELSAEQRARIEGIIRSSQERMKTLRDEVAQKTREEFKEMRQKIRGELRADQRKRFEEIMRQHDERNKREDREAHPTPPAVAKPE